MTQILDICSDCGGKGIVPHVRRVLLEGEVRNPNDLDQYKTEDTCWPCKGSGRLMVDVQIAEPPKQTEGNFDCGC